MAQIIRAASIWFVFLGCTAKPIASPTPAAQRDVTRPAQAASQVPVETQLFDSPDGDFQLQYPASWQVRPNTGHVRFEAGTRFGADSAAVAAGQLPPGTTLDGFVENVIDGFKGPQFEVKAPIERTTITLNGTPAVRLGFIAAAPKWGPGDFHFDVVAAVVKTKGYTLTCTTGHASVPTAKPVFDRIIASMRFTR